MIRTLVAVAALSLTVGQAQADTIWTCKAFGWGFQNEKLTFEGKGTTQGLAQIRAKNKCEKNTVSILKPCYDGPCTRKRF